MAKLSLFLMTVCLVVVVGQCTGAGYYWQTYPQTQEIIGYPQLAPISAVWPLDCNEEEKSSSESKESKESKEGGEEGGSKESKSSSEEGSKEEKGSAEEGSKEEGGEGEGSKAEGSKEEGSKEEGSKEGSKEEGSKEESGEKKESKKKKSKEARYVFPPSSYTFPARPFEQIVYSAPSSYSYAPYRSPYVLQAPITSYPAKSTYQYVSVPTASSVVGSYAAPYRVVSSPVAKYVYSAPAISYPTAAKTLVTPGAQVYSWNSYLKK